MNKTIRNSIVLALLPLLLLSLAACESTTTTSTSDVQAAAGPGGAGEEDGLIWTERAYPTGERQTSAVLVRRGLPAEIQSGQRYEYSIEVVNLTSLPITNLVLTDTAPPDFQVPEGSPTAAVAAGVARWDLGELEGDGRRMVKASGLAVSPGLFQHSSNVSWEAPLVGGMTVTLPRLVLTKSAPDRIVLVDGVTLVYEIANEGTGTAREVRIEELLPEGMQTAEGESMVTLDAGSLAAGSKREFKVDCRMADTGVFRGKATARGFGGIEATSEEIVVQVTRPSLELSAASPERAAIGQLFEQRFTIANRGDGPCRDVVLVQPLAGGAVFVEASDEGSRAERSVRWALGTLEPGAERTVVLKLRAERAEMIEGEATVEGHGAAPATAFARTEMYGIATVALEVHDLADPVEVGKEVTYVVTVTNQGTAPGTNLWLVCTLEQGMGFTSATGATAAKSEALTVKFDPVESLAPKATLTWKVVIKAEQAGDRRFRVSLTGDQFERPVESTEATKFYK